MLPATEGWYLKRDFLDSSLSQWQLLISELQGPDMTVADLLAAEWSKAKIFTGVRLRAVELLLLKLEDGPDVAVFVLPELCCQPWWQQFRSSTKDARWTTTWMKVPSDALVDAREPHTAIGFAAVVGPVPASPTRLIWAMPQHIRHFQRHCAEHERDILRDNQKMLWEP